MTAALDFGTLKDAKRLLIEADLVPVQGHRFQPTGFADLGAATYQLPDGTRMLLVESAQSMANRMEQTILGPDGNLLPAFNGLPYIVAELEGDEGKTETNSLIEAHRVNSPYIMSDETFLTDFKKASGYQKSKPIDWRKVAAALFRYDVNALLHGVFLANLEDGRIKMPRAISGFIEARGVREAVSGGVKNNPIDPSGTLRAASYDKDVYGNVPYQRVEFVAEKISAYFNLDLLLLRSYGLDEKALHLLTTLALYKVRAFLDGGLRLRTACNLRLDGDPRVTEPAGFVLPGLEALEADLKTSIAACKESFAGVTTLKCPVVRKKKSERAGAAAEAQEKDSADEESGE